MRLVDRTGPGVLGLPAAYKTERVAVLWSRVNKDGPMQPHMATPCWEFIGATKTRGYGQFWLGGRQFYCHRLVWLLEKGEIPDGLDVCHACDFTACVRPDHLFLGTHQDNMHDRERKGRRTAPVGELHPNALLTEVKVRYIKERLRAGVSRKEIAKQLGVTVWCVHDIAQGRSWKEVKCA